MAATGTISSPAVSGWMLAVGPHARRAAAAIHAQTNCQLSTADSLLEAVLISGQAAGLILLDVAPEADHLEAGLRSLRRVNPAARIVLLCEPMQEALSRRARSWGADDYEIVPVSTACATALARHVWSATTSPAPENPPAGNSPPPRPQPMRRPSKGHPQRHAPSCPPCP